MKQQTQDLFQRKLKFFVSRQKLSCYLRFFLYLSAIFPEESHAWWNPKEEDHYHFIIWCMIWNHFFCKLKTLFILGAFFYYYIFACKSSFFFICISCFITFCFTKISDCLFSIMDCVLAGDCLFVCRKKNSFLEHKKHLGGIKAWAQLISFPLGGA